MGIEAWLLVLAIPVTVAAVLELSDRFLKR